MKDIVAGVAAWIDTVGPSIRSRSIIQSAPFRSRAGIAHLRLTDSLVRYRMVGDGPQTLVLAADPPVVIEQYDDLFQCLAKTFRVVVFEVPGFGFSLPSLGFRFDFKRANDLVAEFLQQLALGPYILAFPCVTAYSAVDIANRFPELVSGVVLIQAPSWSEEVKWKHGRDKRGLLSTPVIGQVALKLLKRKRAPIWFEAAVGNRKMLSQFVETTDHAFAHGACFCLASAFQCYLTDRLQPLVAVQQSSLVIWGEQDRSHRHTDKSSSKLYCPDAQNLHFKTAGHFPELEEPELFSNTVKEWFCSIKT